MKNRFNSIKLRPRAIQFWILWILGIIFAAFLVWIVYQVLPKNDFRDTFLGGFLATIIGIILGIPIALELSKAQDLQEEKEREKERMKHERKLLTLLCKELGINLEILKYGINAQQTEPKVVTYSGHRNDLWNALSDSRELQWINDLELLDAIADSYSFIGRLIFLEAVYYDPGFNMSLTIETGDSRIDSYSGKSAVDAVQAIRPAALEVIEKTLLKIRKSLDERLSEQNF